MIIDRAKIKRNALCDKVAVVTGAGQGIGKETARILAHLGACVVIAEINDTGAETERLIKAEGGRAYFVKTDIADEFSVDHLHEHVDKTFGPVSILVNNAETNVMKTLLEHSLAEWDRVFAVNLRGVFVGIKAFLPEMLERKDGVVITMQSAEGMPFMSSYLATKVGLRSLALSLAGEVGEESGVSVYCFGPGMVETPGAMAAFRQLAPLYQLTLDEFIKQSAPGGQLISPELCATGLVGTVLYAKDFHGQGDAGYILGLSKLGLDPRGDPWRTDEKIVQPNPCVPVELPNDEWGMYQLALVWNRKLEEILRVNINEYKTSSMFQRPIIKRMFQQSTGLKVEDWLASAVEMSRRLESISRGSADDQYAELTFDAYIVQLKRLSDFVAKQESDARGWIRDPKQLSLALDALRIRKETIEGLEQILLRIQRLDVVPA